MGKYGNTAVRAVEILRSSRAGAEDAWREAAAEIFPTAPEARAKVCPRETFLGLVQRGLVIGIDQERCTPAEGNKNRMYAFAAAELLVQHPELASGTKAEFWRQVMRHVDEDPEKQHNQQLDVVLTLGESGLLTSYGSPRSNGLSRT